MNAEVFSNIDTLINMADSELSIDEVNAELISLNRQIRNKQNEIEDLESLMTDSRYFNASNELVDKNIEISLKNKISRLNRKIKEVKNNIEEIKNREKSLYENINSLKSKIEINKSYIAKLKTKVTSLNNNYYNTLLENEEKNEILLGKELDDKTTNYDELLKELEDNNIMFNNLNNKLEAEKHRLNDVLDNLENPGSYVDEDLKQSDTKKLDSLKEDLVAIEERKAMLLNNASMIGADAKELIANNNIMAALNKIKELVAVVKKKPYMDINSHNILEEELEKKESLRAELATLIDNKSYDEVDNNSLNARIDYLNMELDANQKSIETYQKEINAIDSFVNEKLSVNINDLELTILKLEKSISKSHNLLREKKNSPRNKASIENDLIKKEKEKNILNEVLNGYKKDLLAKIDQTNLLSNLIKELEAINVKYNEEKSNLDKLSLLDLKTKNYAEEDSDKEELKRLNEEIKAIKNRQKFDKTPDEIYDQIDMALAAVMPKYSETKPEVDYLFTSSSDGKSSKTTELIKVIEMIPVETVKQESNSEAGGN